MSGALPTTNVTSAVNALAKRTLKDVDVTGVYLPVSIYVKIIRIIINMI